MEPSSKSEEALQGFKYVMKDGTRVVTEIVSDHHSINRCLHLITKRIRDKKDMVVGFDTEWSFVDVVAAPFLTGRVEAKVVLIKLYSCIGCVLIRLDPRSGSVSPSLKTFLLMKDIMFSGVHIKEDLKKLKEQFGLEVRNAVELSELVANCCGKPFLIAYGARELAGAFSGRVLHNSVDYDQRPYGVVWMNWGDHGSDLTPEQIECATTDAYVNYKIAKDLQRRY